jgi:bifunctional aromatase (cyclase/dehydratase)
MTQQIDRPDSTRQAETYHQVQQFYARQMRLLDSGEAEQWADTFTEDGVFHQNVDPAPLEGRPAIAVAARRRIETIKSDDLTRRHWLGMLETDEQPDGTVRTRYYAMAMATPQGGRLEVYVSTVSEDVLVRTQDGWLVKHRYVVHDGR